MPTPEREHIGHRIQRALDANPDHLSVAGLAEAAGVTVQAVYNKWIKLGQIKREHLAAASKYLGVSFELLLTGNYPAIRSSRVAQLHEGSGRRGSGDDTSWEIGQLNVSGGMAPDGVLAPEHVEVVHQIRVNPHELRRLVSFTAPKNLYVVTGLGDSMKPTFSDGDPLIVDAGVNEVTVDGVYVLEREGRTDRNELFIKRIQRRPITDEWLMISDNGLYPPQVFSSEEWKKFRVTARVLLAWNARRL